MEASSLRASVDLPSKRQEAANETRDGANMRMNRGKSETPGSRHETALGVEAQKQSWIMRKLHVCNPVFPFFVLGLLMLVPGVAHTQEQSIPAFPAPTTTGVLGRKDAGALSEIEAHLLAVSAAGWQALEASGMLTYPEGDAHSATLYLAGSQYSRLDIEMGTGTRSVRIGRASGRFQGEKGNWGSLPPATADAGIVAFPRIWADAATSSRISLYNHNTSAYNGQNLHRVTIEYPIDIGAASGFTNKKTGATDLYFDPNTHLLLYSVDAVKFNGVARQTFSRETSYGDYQQSSGIKVPMTVKQYLNGQLQWTLQLSQITINAAPAANTFSF